MNLALWIDWWARRTPERTALCFKGRSITYAGLDRDIRAMATVLERLGAGTGDRVAWLGFNSPETLIALMACARIGALLVPLNTRLAPAEHLAMLRDSGASLLIYDPRFSDTAKQCASALADCRVLPVGPDPVGPEQPSLARLMSDADGTDAASSPVSSDHPVLIMYTSGTTGEPKGAVLTQDAVHWNALNSQFMHDLRRGDHVLTTLPFFHVGGLNIQTLPALRVGATVSLVEKFEPGDFLRRVAADRPTLTVLVPTQMLAIAQHPDWSYADLSSLRMVTTGSTMVQVPLLDIWHQHDVPVIQVYGCTETGPIAIHQVEETAHSGIGSVGQAARYCEIRIVDDEARDLPPGEPGEILVRGRNVMTEYWRNPAATKRSLKSGWLHTGDIGVVDASGCYKVVDRKKRVIISGGENIYPSELERILLRHPDVAEAVVVAFPDERWGEVPAAALVLRDARVDRATLAALFEAHIGPIKHPRRYVVFDALPRNAMGKVVLDEVGRQIVACTTDNANHGMELI